jgi:hypothetical protein
MRINELAGEARRTAGGPTASNKQELLFLLSSLFLSPCGFSCVSHTSSSIVLQMTNLQTTHSHVAGSQSHIAMVHRPPPPDLCLGKGRTLCANCDGHMY